MNQGDTDSAARLLGQINHHIRERPVTGPEGHSYISSAPRATAVTPALPINVRALDHVAGSVRELTELTDTVNPEPTPLPPHVEGVYSWCVDNTDHAPEATRLRRDTVIYRQYLEHALYSGDRSVIRRHRCPECRTWGLMWQADRQAALCTNSECLDADGCSTTVTLARLAHEHVTKEKKLRQVSAT